MDNTSSTQVIGVASGKGGVGKTTVSVNLAVALQLMGHQVMLFDPYNLSHFLAGQKTLQEIIITTRSGVKLVPGASGVQEMADLSPAQIQRIVENRAQFEARCGGRGGACCGRRSCCLHSATA